MGREQGSREEPANRPLPPPGSWGLPTSRENQATGRGERPGGGNLLALPPHPTPPVQSTKSPRVPWDPTILRGVTLGLHCSALGLCLPSTRCRKWHSHARRPLFLLLPRDTKACLLSSAGCHPESRVKL